MNSDTFTPPDYDEIQRRIRNEGGSYWGGYLKQGIYGATPTQKKAFTGRILPMFDYDLSTADENFLRSWSPYRNADKINSATGQPELTGFFGVAACYSWFGNKNVSFVSPSSRRFIQGITKGAELIDPVFDIRMYAKKHADPAIRALIERNENKKDAKVVLPYANIRYFFNFYGSTNSDRIIKNYVIDVSKKGFEDLADKLGEWRPGHETVLDPAWPNYLFGDITNPALGLMVDTVQIPGNPQPFNGFIFTNTSHKSLKGTRQLAVPEEALLNRVHFYGDNSAFKIMDAQEIVDFLVEDGAIPYHLIQEVCSHYCSVPPEPKRQTVFPGAQDDEDGEMQHAYVPVGTPVNPVPQNKPTVSTEEHKAFATDVAWWVMDSNAVVGRSAAVPEANIKEELARKPGCISLVCKVGGNTWVTPEEAGIVSVAPASPPRQVAPPPPPQAPPPPVQQTAPSVAPVVSSSPASRNLPLDAWATEDKESYLRLKAMFENNTIAPSDLPQYVKYVTLLGDN